MTLLVRDDKDFAIEHAEYLAKAAEAYMNLAGVSQNPNLPVDTQVDLSERFRNLKSCIYEFRKRAEKARTS